MLVTLHPGANRGDVLEVLTRIRAEADNATGPGNAGAAGRLTGYLEWAARSARMLHNRIKAADIDRLILTRGYDRLLAAAGSLTGTDTGIQRVLNGLIDMELRLRAEALNEIISDLRSPNPQWCADDLVCGTGHQRGCASDRRVLWFPSHGAAGGFILRPEASTEGGQYETFCPGCSPAGCGHGR